MVVAGVGGVGGAAATYLAAAGIGRLVLIHPGSLEEPDLNRQTLMLPGLIGAARVEVAAATLAAHYPDVAVETWNIDLFDERVPGLIASAQAVVDARHNFPERYQINHLCLRHRIPLVFAAMNATEAQLLVVSPGGACLRCVFEEGDPSWSPLGFGVLGAVAGTVGCLAAMETIKIVSGFGEPSVGRLISIDLWDTSFATFPAMKNPDCPECSPRPTGHVSTGHASTGHVSAGQERQETPAGHPAGIR